MRLLVVEDNQDLSEAISSAFRRRHVSCDLAHRASDAEQLCSTTHYEVIILDIGLPDEDGVSLLKRLRGRGNKTPIILLTARSEPEMRVAGLRAGADDYLVKPFWFDELHARVEALLRRATGYTDAKLEAGRLSLNTDTRELTIGDVQVDASTREVELLEILLRRKDHVTPRRIVEDQLFGAGEALGSNAVEVYVHRLRRKLEQNQAEVSIKTVRGVGYMLMAGT
ncbi:DNA-binding response regulator [Sphingomonas ginkgonis]|uniref:DNA-binding response regulator n=1 Tax=Sphingomonas ginkgonis TaxID=2315330 RepID=A0A3R9YNT3_9SPHN|nr:response regulator transcription factor [Sphingomonas ginkgonis]RST31722.1 DNA-binding response regulator [Sphingomonas ginkgonis]